MKNHYSQSNKGNGAMGGLMRLLGFVFALILVIGMLDKAGLKVSLDGQKEGPSGKRYYEASVGDNNSGEESGPETIYVAPDEPSRSSGQAYQPRSYNEYSSTAPSRGSQPGMSVDAFISHFAETATAQALDKGVPAGVSLALGIAKLQQGERIENWQDFMNKVVTPLARIKENAARDGLQPYFKYSANSSRWLEGLGRQGDYSYNALRQAMQQYRLDAYDEEVRTALSGGTRVSPEMDRQASFVADEVASNIVTQRAAYEQQQRSGRKNTANAEKWEGYYNEVVGREVAKEVAKRKLKTGQYITDEDMGRLVEEANVETEKVMKKNLSFLGRDINRNHPDAPEMLDITKPGNAQARQELYQKKLKERDFASNR